MGSTELFGRVQYSPENLVTDAESDGVHALVGILIAGGNVVHAIPLRSPNRRQLRGPG